MEINNSNQFKVNELIVVTKAGKVDITMLYEEINIFDSILMPVMSGNILIRDAVGLSAGLLFDGSESILIDISKFNDDTASFKKAFRIYKQSDRKNINQTSEVYVLHFVSDELFYSDQQKINQSYEDTYSEIIKNILKNYLLQGWRTDTRRKRVFSAAPRLPHLLSRVSDVRLPIQLKTSCVIL